MYRSYLGRIRPYYRGAYSAVTEYEYLDYVTTDDGSYIYINTNKSTGNAPAVETDSAYWACMSKRGAQGITGVQGIQGIQGPKGDTGAQGIQGPKGDTGPQGIQGPKGDTGPQGIQGETGPAGPAGAQGTSRIWIRYSAVATPTDADVTTTPNEYLGVYLAADVAEAAPTTASSYTWYKIKGDKGDTGAQGPQGIQGEKGDTGAQGPQGIQGEKGDTGPQGPAGADGTGVQLSTTTPLEDAETAALGTDTAAARGDHKHPITNNLIAPTEKVQTLGSLSANTTIDCANGNIATLTVAAAITLTLTANAASGRCRTLTLIITNGGAYTITWPTGVKWAGGAAPTLTASGIGVLTFMTVDGGTTWLGAANGVSFA